jgi:hypothetical protein
MSGRGRGWGARGGPGPLATPNTTRRATASTNEPRAAFLSVVGDQAGRREAAGGHHLIGKLRETCTHAELNGNWGLGGRGKSPSR